MCGGLAAAPVPAGFSVSGTIRHRGNLPLGDARITIAEARSSSITGPRGRFRVQVPRPGFYTLRIDHETGVWFVRRELQPGLALEISLPAVGAKSTTSDSDALVVTGLRDNTRLSRYRLDKEEVKRLPGAYGDSLKAVTTLPGVGAALPPGSFPSVNVLGAAQGTGGLGLAPPYRNNFVNGFLVLRGAGPLSNSFLFDGFKVEYPFHLGDQSSVINNEMIQALDIYTGTFPARFGDAAGGVIAITGPDEVKRPSGKINLALFLADAYLEVPIPFGFVAAGGRRSYPNYTLLQAYPDAIPQDAKYASYSDGQAKISFEPFVGHTFSAVLLAARDLQRYTKSVAEADRNAGSTFSLDLTAAGALDTNSDTRPPVDLDRGFRTSGVRYDARLGSRMQNMLLVQLSDYREDFRLDFRSPLTGESIFSFKVLNAKHEFQAREEFVWEVIEKLLLVRAGGEWSRRRWELSLENLSPRQSVNPNTPNVLETINRLIDENRTFRALYDGDRTEYDIQSTYLETEWSYGSFRVLPGVRTDYFSLSRSTAIGPRLRAEYGVPNSGFTILAGAGRHFNVPQSLEQISVESGNPYLEMEEADRSAAGIEYKRGALLVKVEAFRNVFRNLVVADDYNYRSLSVRQNKRDLVEKQADLLARPVEARPLFFSNDGTGWSEGVEVHIKKSRPPERNGWFGWISYTNSLTKRNNHQPRLTNAGAQALAVRNRNREVLGSVAAGPAQALYYDNGEIELMFDNDREELYDLDRTHQASLVLNYRFNERHQLGARWRYADNVPITPIVGSTTVAGGGLLNRPTFLPKYSEDFNSERLAPTHQLDLRYDYFIRYSFGYANMFVELINFYGRRNEEPSQFSTFDFLYPYNRGVNPAPSYESTYMETPSGNGRTLRLPLINVGLEVKF